ncbi:MAG: GFA family protein [Rhodospirillaceae bacterium]|nr:GFA family protein [Rhodospirillaceae bacterium]
MAEAAQVRTGGCRCGAVRYRATGKPRWVAHCHCVDCRKQTSAGYATWLGYETSQVLWEKGAPKLYASSPGVARGFCGDCGTPLSYAGARWPDEIHLLAGTLDEPASIAPRAHVYVSDAVPWVHIPPGDKRFAKTSKEGGPLA